MTEALSRLGLAALTYSQEYGWPVFPVEERGKSPLIDGGFRAASTHPEQVCEWWDKYPDANIGFSPGAADCVVFDLDSPDAEQVARELGLLDATSLRVKTYRGHHLYFRVPAGTTLGNRSPWKDKGIDIRAHAGYVLLPPSVHESGFVYAWQGSVE